MRFNDDLSLKSRKDKDVPYELAKECLTRGLDLLRDGLHQFVEQILIERDGKYWHQQAKIQRMISVAAQEYAETGPSLDLALLLKIIGSESYWQRTFRLRLPGVSLWMIDSLKDLRNRIAHDDGTDPLFLNRQLVLQLLGNMRLILNVANCKQMSAIEELVAEVNPSTRHAFIRVIKGKSKWSMPVAGMTVIVAITIGLAVQHSLSPKLDRQVITIGTADPQFKNYELLRWEIEKRLKRKNLIDHLLGRSVEVRLERVKSYPEAIAHIKKHDWQLLFGYSPVVSMHAVEAGYHGIGLMFSGNPNYRALFFAKKGSRFRSINDFNENTRLALGDYFSASKYYVPLSMLKGRKLLILENNSTAEIISLVRNGKTDIGVIAGGSKNFLSEHNDLEIVSTSIALPQSIVGVSPYVSENDREVLQKVLFSIPKNQRGLGKADYSSGVQPDYLRLRRAVEIAKTLSACMQKFSELTLLECPNGGEVVAIDGWIDDVLPFTGFVRLKVSTTSSKAVFIDVEKSNLASAASIDTLAELRSRRIRVIVFKKYNAQREVYRLRSPNQIEFID